jgi:hypothetical protein
MAADFLSISTQLRESYPIGVSITSTKNLGYLKTAGNKENMVKPYDIAWKTTFIILIKK